MSFSYIRFLALAIPVLGLISCTVYKEKDPWQRKAHAEWNEDGHARSESLTSSTAPAISVTAKIIFDDTSIVSGTVVSVCSGGDAMSNKQAHHAIHSSEMMVSDLLPAETWKQFGWKAESIVTCSFAFNVVNTTGSTWEFKIPSVAVRRLDLLVNLKLETSSSNWSLTGDEFNFDGLSATPEGISTVDLVCEKFRNSRTYSAMTPVDKIAHELVYGKLDTQFGTADLRQSYAEQNCQFSMVSQDARGNTVHRLSQEFNAQFEAHEVHREQIEVKEFGMPNGQEIAESSQAKIFQIKITDTTTVPIQYKLFNPKGANVLTQEVIRGWSDAAPVEVYTGQPAHFEYETEGAKLISETATEQLYEVQPGITWVISATFQKDFTCLFDTVTIPRAEHFRNQRDPIYMGNAYQLTAGKFISAVRLNLHGANTEIPLRLLSGETQIKDSILFGGWMPLAGWAEYAGTIRPSNTKANPGLICNPKGVPFRLFN